MDTKLKRLLIDFINDYLDKGLCVNVHITIDENAGMALRTDLIEKAISDGLKDIADSICSSISDDLVVHINDD